MATVHLLCGLPGSGKTTVARRLAAERQAVRFTLDEWMLTLFDLTPYDTEYGAQADRVKELIWLAAAGVLAIGHDLVLDWSLWSRPAREVARRRAEALGADVLLHYLDVPLAVAEERLAERNLRAASRTHQIDLADLRRFATEVFEAPGPDEAVPIVLEREAGR